MKIEMLPERLVQRSLPSNIRAQDRVHFEKHLSHTLPTRFEHRIKSAYVDGKGVIFDGHRINEESFVPTKPADGRRRFLAHARRVLQYPFAKKIDSGLWFTDPWSSQYYHFLAEAMPRLEASMRLERPACLLLPEALKRVSYIMECLDAYDVPIRFVGTLGAAKIGDLRLPEHTDFLFDHDPLAIQALGERLRNHFGNGSKAKRRIFISRRKAQMRRICNEEQLRPLLAAAGFETIVAEDLTFAEQARIFSETEILIAPHGAGLTNMILMPPRGKIYEIAPRAEHGITHCFFTLADAAQHEYFYSFATPSGRSHQPYNDDLIVDISEFERDLNSISNAQPDKAASLSFAS